MTIQTTNPEKLKVQATHILKSYLRALNIRFAENGDIIEVSGKSRKVKVLVGEGAAEISLAPSDIASPRYETALAALHRVTEAAGYGKPLPVDRGQKEGRPNYLDNFEDVYLRHSLFRRAPNLSREEMEPYMATIRGAARRAAYRWRSVFQPMGFGESDLVTVGMVYAIGFIHNYATSTELVDNIRLMTEFLTQRFGEFAKLSYRKALNATCLPQAVQQDRASDGTFGEETSYIDRCAESDGASPDEEYMEDHFLLTFSNGQEKNLRAENDGMLGINMYLDGVLLSRAEARALTEDIRDGKVQKKRVEAEVLEEAPMNEHARREKAREELYKRLGEMGSEQREILLGYAAFSRDYDPDARREARRISDELACEKCFKKVPAGNVCLSCGGNAVPRFGVDYVAVKSRLEAEHHSMSEAMTAQIPDSEARMKNERAVPVTNTALVDSAPMAVQPKKVKASAKKPVEKMTAEELEAEKRRLEYKARVEEKRKACFDALPPFRVCPKCKQNLPKERFGVRVAKNKKTGEPAHASVMPYCTPCRAMKN